MALPLPLPDASVLPRQSLLSSSVLLKGSRAMGSAPRLQVCRMYLRGSDSQGQAVALAPATSMSGKQIPFEIAPTMSAKDDDSES